MPGWDRRDGRGQTGEQLELRVGLDQLDVVLHRRWARSRCGPRRRPCRAQERRTPPGRAAGCGGRSPSPGTPELGRRGRPPSSSGGRPAMRSSIGPDERCHDREWGHRQREVQEHLPACVVRIEVEEERVGQRDGDERVASGGERVRPGQSRERRETEAPRLRPARGLRRAAASRRSRTSSPS